MSRLLELTVLWWLNRTVSGSDPRPCIEIPLVGKVDELVLLKKLVHEVLPRAPNGRLMCDQHTQLAAETGAKGRVKYEVGTMIEVCAWA